MRSAPDRYSARFFISYAHADYRSAALAESLCRGLRKQKFDAFIDSGMSVGTDWVSEIESHISSSDFFVVLISEEVLRSEMVQAEVRLAYQENKRTGRPRLVPIRVGYVGRLDYELESYLGRLQWRNWNDDAKALLHELSDLVHTGKQPKSIDMVSGGTLPSSGVDPRRPTPLVDPRVVVAPGGTLAVDDPFYVERKADHVVRQRATILGQTLVIKAPRQMGKSSLLLRFLGACKEAEQVIAFIDFSCFTDSDLQNYEQLLTDIAGFLVHNFGTSSEAPRITRQLDLTYLVDGLLQEIPQGGVVAFDEVDCVLGKPFQKDFFSMLRLWHNKRAEIDSPWSRLSMALVISTEPYLLIDSPDRSPFNVTPAIELDGFSYSQCMTLNEMYGNPLHSGEVEDLYELLQGHPYLTRLSMYKIVVEDYTLSSLIESSASDDGPFTDHLHALLLKIDQQPRLLSALHNLFHKGSIRAQDDFYRLHGAGLVRRELGRVRPANRLYEIFFKSII